jgi:hypothetical protein
MEMYIWVWHNMATNELNPGDWVRTLSPGIWQIERIDSQLDLGSESDPRIAFCKRLLNDRFKRSFDRSSFHYSLLRQINERDKAELDRFITDHPKVMAEFVRYHRPCDLVFNAQFCVGDGPDRESFKQRVTTRLGDLSNGLHRAELEAHLREETERSSRTTIRDITVQFVSPDQILRGGRPIYTEFRFLDF